MKYTAEEAVKKLRLSPRQVETLILHIQACGKAYLVQKNRKIRLLNPNDIIEVEG